MDTREETYLNWIDIVKGIGIILVVIGHSFRPGMRLESHVCEFIYQFIYFFHMPLFFAVSGRVFYISYEKYIGRKSEFFKRKLQTLLVPMVSYAMAIYVIFEIANFIPRIHLLLQSANYSQVSVFHYIITNLVGENPYAVHLWFIWVLFLISIFIFYIYSNTKISKAFLSVLIMLSAFIVRLILDKPVLVVHYFLTNIVYFCLGLLIAYMPDLLSKKSIILLSQLGWICLVLIVLRKTFYGSVFISYYLEESIYLVVRCLVLISVFIASIHIKRNHFLEILGRNSFTVYLLHQPFCCGFMGTLLYNKLRFPIPIVCAICICLSFLLPFLFQWMIQKNRITARIGKILLNI